MSNEKLSRARKLCAELQSLLLDLAVDYTIEAKNSSPNKRKPKRVSKYVMCSRCRDLREQERDRERRRRKAMNRAA